MINPRELRTFCEVKSCTPKWSHGTLAIQNSHKGYWTPLNKNWASKRFSPSTIFVEILCSHSHNSHKFILVYSDSARRLAHSEPEWTVGLGNLQKVGEEQTSTCWVVARKVSHSPLGEDDFFARKIWTTTSSWTICFFPLPCMSFPSLLLSLPLTLSWTSGCGDDQQCKKGIRNHESFNRLFLGTWCFPSFPQTCLWIQCKSTCLNSSSLPSPPPSLSTFLSQLSFLSHLGKASLHQRHSIFGQEFGRNSEERPIETRTCKQKWNHIDHCSLLVGQFLDQVCTHHICLSHPSYCLCLSQFGNNNQTDSARIDQSDDPNWRRNNDQQWTSWWLFCQTCCWDWGYWGTCQSLFLHQLSNQSHQLVISPLLFKFFLA